MLQLYILHNMYYFQKVQIENVAILTIFLHIFICHYRNDDYFCSSNFLGFTSFNFESLNL